MKPPKYAILATLLLALLALPSCGAALTFRQSEGAVEVVIVTPAK
jgi:hypothetical protein